MTNARSADAQTTNIHLLLLIIGTI